MSAAIAIDGARWNLGGIAGPALAGFAVTGIGLGPSYALVPAFYVLSLGLLWRIEAAPPRENASKASVRSLVEGVRYAVSRPDLVGTYLVDIAANLFAYVTALYPFLADELHSPKELGLLYSAWGVGALAASVTSGWTRYVHRHGLAVILAASSWGVAIALAGAMPNLWLVLVFLCLGGVADMISGVFRMTLWNQTIPDELRGRLAGIEMLSYMTGPMMGNARAGFMAQLGGVRFSLGAGGLLCVGAVAAMAAALPKFRRYDERTDEHATAERARRAAAAATA
jgi:MFS family permease